MRKRSISVIVCTYNRAENLREALNNLICQETEGKFFFEIFVVDDGSTDETRHVVEEVARHSQVPVIYAKAEGKGYAHALNKGITASHSEWLAFFDDDERTDPGWLKELYHTAIQMDAELAGGPVELDISEEELSSMGLRLRALRGEYPPSCGISRRSKSPPLPSGGNRLIKRMVFDSIGLFDEKMITGGCDRDLVLRARDAGFNNVWVPNAIVRHLVPSYRLKVDHIKWTCLQGGCSFAYIDWKRWGLWKTLLFCVARIGYTLLITVPFLFLGYIRRSRIEVLDNKIQLWRNIGYVRKALFLLSPDVFRQEKFFCQMEFRKHF